MNEGFAGLDLCGIVPPMITPLLDPDRLDPVGLERVVELLVGGGVRGIFALGTTGEAASLSYRLRREVIERTCALVRHRVPVVVGITDTALEESVALGRFAADAGAAALVVAAPYLMPPGQAELRAYLSVLLERLPLPLVLYHCPPLTRTMFEMETVRWAMDQPRILGLKDSSGDLAYFGSLCGLLPRRPEWRLLAGPEQLLVQTMSMGGHGGVCGGANLFPGLYTRLFEAARAGETEAAERLQASVAAVGAALYHFQAHPTSFIKGIKAALSMVGVCRTTMAWPFTSLGDAELQGLQAAFEKLREQLGSDAAPWVVSS